jgi:biotin operon repressor
MKIARWYYVKDPDQPKANGAGTPFHHPRMYAEIARAVGENPRLTGSEIAALLGKSREYVSPLLFHLKRYGGALRTETAGFYRTSGLDELRQAPAVLKMLSKLGSEKTKGSWTRRVFRYEQWLKEKWYFGSITEALQDYEGANDKDARYRHVVLTQEYLNSWGADRDTKDSRSAAPECFQHKMSCWKPTELLQ